MGSLSTVPNQVSNALRTLAGVAAYMKDGRTPNFAYQSMLQLFCATGGVSNDAMSSFIGLLNRPYQFQDACGALGDFSESDIESIGSDIENNGYHVFKERLPDALCDELLQYATTMPCVRRGTDGEGNSDTRLERFPREKPDGVRYDFSEEELINHPLIQKLMADRSFIAIAQRYLRAQPIIDVVAMWWNVVSARPDKGAAQFWHFDMDRIKWLKFFVYLTDVQPENGPHSFVSGSHRNGGISSDLLQKGYSRLSDEEVSSHYSPDKFIEFTAPRGTVIAEDTRGLHKGKHLTKGDRLIFQMQFSNSLFGGDYPKSTIRNAKSPQLAEMMTSYPRLYSHYT
jgi:ectoine hydroxylase-related dioxygenase (phytanoyl-CoA dioxygenase family)